jgi:hypothetical protein
MLCRQKCATRLRGEALELADEPAHGRLRARQLLGVALGLCGEPGNLLLETVAELGAEALVAIGGGGGGGVGLLMRGGGGDGSLVHLGVDFGELLGALLRLRRQEFAEVRQLGLGLGPLRFEPVEKRPPS